jgi:hypothetical protein
LYYRNESNHENYGPILNSPITRAT